MVKKVIATMKCVSSTVLATEFKNDFQIALCATAFDMSEATTMELFWYIDLFTVSQSELHRYIFALVTKYFNSVAENVAMLLYLNKQTMVIE